MSSSSHKGTNVGAHLNFTLVSEASIIAGNLCNRISNFSGFVTTYAIFIRIDRSATLRIFFLPRFALLNASSVSLLWPRLACLRIARKYEKRRQRRCLTVLDWFQVRRNDGIDSN